MRKPEKILFLQLPHLDNHSGKICENVPLAAFYLQHAMIRSGEEKYFSASNCPASFDKISDSSLIAYIVVRKRPSVIVATLYLWNVERTIDVLRAVKKRLPEVKVLLGGPEVAPDHPFLFKSGIADAVAVGEGEQVFPEMLKALRTGKVTDLAPVAWRKGKRYVFGKNALAKIRLLELLPPASYRFNKPDPNGVSYMETSRGCPLKCAFCCYNQKRRGVSCISAGEVLKRVKVLISRGAREIRFVDPTFNSNPDFEEILTGLAALNRRHGLKFFAELRAETVTQEQAYLLKKANFREIEVGVQSRNADVLRAIRRPTGLAMLDRGVRYMSERGIKLTVDIMCGLPSQSLHDIRRSLRWAFGVKNSYVQFLHTLLLPGTELRSRRHEFGLESQAMPPYRVTATDTMSTADMNTAEKIAWRRAGRPMDSPAERFVGKMLPDIFEEQVRVDLSKGVPAVIPGKMSLRAVIIEGDNLYGQIADVCSLIGLAVQQEPHALWQFVLSPRSEEPLEMLDAVIGEIDRHPPHLLDNMAVNPEGRRRVARRVFVLLRNGGIYSRSWINAVEELLLSSFY